MLRQLIADEDDQLAEIDDEENRYLAALEQLQRKREKSKARRDRWTEMLNELEQRIEENS